MNTFFRAFPQIVLAVLAIFSASEAKCDVNPTPTTRPTIRAVPRTDRNSQLAHEQLLQKPKAGRIDVYFEGDSITRRWGTSDAAYKDSVKQALQQAELEDVSVDEDRDKNTITLGGKVHSEDARIHAGQVAQAAAGGRTIANQISVQPVGAESESKEIASDLDSAIEKNYKAALTAKGLEKQHIRFDAKNGVLTLKGRVKTRSERNQAEELAQATPHVRQVLNQIELDR